jgi:hypothetical protein
MAAQPEDTERAAIEAVSDTLLDIARRSVVMGLDSGKPAQFAVDARLPPLLATPGAAFVTLRRHGALRGCIGSPAAWRPLIQDVAEHAFNAAFKDPRFSPLHPDELQGLALSISVLTPPVALTFISEADLLTQLCPSIDGLIIQGAGCSALFLPSVWDELPDKRQFLTHLKLKAGLPAAHVLSGFSARRFRAIEVKGAWPLRGPEASPQHGALDGVEPPHAASGTQPDGGLRRHEDEMDRRTVRLAARS